jgi:HEAT repeat protein
MGFGGGDTNVTERYNKAKKGANIGEWVRRLNDDDPETRLEAVKSLGESGDAKAVEPLMQAAGDQDPRVQAKAVDFLGTTRATDATFFLVQRLFLADTPDPLRHRILNALGKIGDPAASRPILDYVSRDTPLDLRGTGIFALGEIGDPAARGDLVAMLDSERDARLRILIQEAVTKIDTRQAAPQKNEGPFPSPLEAALQTERP